jgi:hypothetical protein
MEIIDELLYSYTESAMINFIVVLLFNAWWAKDGIKTYFDLYKWEKSRWISVFLWFFAAFGIANFVYAWYMLD